MSVRPRSTTALSVFHISDLPPKDSHVSQNEDLIRSNSFASNVGFEVHGPCGLYFGAAVFQSAFPYRTSLDITYHLCSQAVRSELHCSFVPATFSLLQYPCYRFDELLRLIVFYPLHRHCLMIAQGKTDKSPLTNCSNFHWRAIDIFFRCHFFVRELLTSIDEKGSRD